MFSRIAFYFHNSTDFFTGVFGVPFIDDIAEGCELVVALGTVYTVIHRNKVNIMFRKHDLGIHTDLQIITPETRHIFDDTLASVHYRQFVLGHQLLSQFLITEAVRNLAAPVFRLIEAVDGLLAQQLRDLLQGGFLLASQKQGAVAVTHDGIRRVLVDGL